MKNTRKRKGKKTMLIAILIIVVLIFAGVSGGILVDAPARREIKKLNFGEVDFNDFRDGSYIGEYKGNKSHSRDTKVKVEIKKGKISDITILKGALDKEGNPAKLTGGKSIDDLFDNVVKEQTLQVDVISGATLTSKTHLKALESALKQAEQ